jgi:hypothetical protein
VSRLAAPRPVLGALAATLLAACLLLPTHSTAFDSRVSGTAPLSDQPSGREAARHQYYAEHVPYLDGVLAGSGIPQAIGGSPSDLAWNQERTLWVPTLDTALTGFSNQPYTVLPVDPSEAARLRPRAIVPSMFAELPDFSYSLYDWISGNETCPPDPATSMGGDADGCHAFRGWMGALNSTHFPPQASSMHWHYDQLSRNIGEVCTDYQDAMGYGLGNAGPIPAYLAGTLDCGDDGLCAGDEGYPGADSGEADGLDDYLVQCQALQLMLEGVGQHFLQDVWSSGHMWHRWGGPLPANNLSLSRAMAVAMASGLIHGSKAVTQMNDRMCSGSEWQYVWGSPGRTSPGGDMTFVDPTTTIVTTSAAYSSTSVHEGLGDLHMTTLATGGGWVWTSCAPRNWNTVFQASRLQQCATLSLRQTYAAGPQIYGSMGGYSAAMPTTDDERCIAPRATNKRMYHGSQLDLNFPLPVPSIFDPINCDLDFDNWILWGMLAYQASPSVSEVALLKAEMVRIKTKLWAARWADADGFGAATDSGRWGLGSMMGIPENGAFNGPAAYADPVTPWDGLDVTGAEDEEELALLRAFNRSFPEYWCHRDRMGQDKLNVMRRRCQGIGTYSTLDADAKEASCQVCEEFASRHVRIGCSDTDETYTDVTIDRQPVCGLVAEEEDVDFLYLDIDPDDPMAQDASLAAANYCRDDTPAFGPCVDLYLFDDYDTTYCSVSYYPWFMCMGCSSCIPMAPLLVMVDSPWEEEDLNWSWSFTGGYPADLNSLDTTFIYDYLMPPTCGYTATGYGSVSIEVWDPYFTSSTIAFDSGQSSCYGSY